MGLVSRLDENAASLKAHHSMEGSMSRTTNLAAAVFVILAASACDEDRNALAPDGITAPKASQLSEFASPAGIVTLSLAGVEADVWPYTSTGFGTTPQDP